MMSRAPRTASTPCTASRRRAKDSASPASTARLKIEELGNRVMTTPGRLAPLATSLLLTLLWWLGLNSLGGLLTAGPWLLQALAVCAATQIVAGLMRTLLPLRPLLAVLTALAAGAGVVAWVGRASPFPEMWWHDHTGALAAIRVQIVSGIPPISPGPALVSLILLACLLLSWASAVLSAGGGDAVAVSGLVPAAALLLPALFLSATPPATTVLATGICLLALILLGAPDRYWPARSHEAGHAHGPRHMRRLSATAMTALALALGGVVVNAVPAQPDHVWNPRGAASTVPDLNLALSADLVRGTNHVAFSYTSQAEAESMRFTLGVITDLGEGAWSPDATIEEATVNQPRPDDAAAALTAGGALNQAGVTPQDARTRLNALTITTRSLRTDRLPTLQSTALVTEPLATPSSLPPGAKAAVPEFGQWHWIQRSTTALAVRHPLDPGATYSLLGWNAVADAAGRPRTPVPLPPLTPAPEALEAYTALPGELPQAVSNLAQEAVAQAGSERGAQAAALAARLRGPDFTYDESAPYDTEHATSLEAIAAFVEQRSGYCVHYASAFTVMARSLGIPTRIAVGYASRSGGPGVWTAVTGHQLHAWPEVWLDDVGWVAFEPTPGGAGMAADAGAQGALTEAAAQPTLPPPASALPITPADALASPTDGAQAGQPSAPASATQAPGAEADGAEVSGQWGAVLAVTARILGGVAGAGAALVPATLPLLVRRAQRRRRIAQVHSGSQPAQAAWSEMLATARDLGLLGGKRKEHSAYAATEDALEEILRRNVAAARAGAAGVDTDPGGDADLGAAAESERDLRDPRGVRDLHGLRDLRQAVVAERYGPAGSGGLSGEDLLTALEACIGDMSAAVGRGARLRARVVPASLFHWRRGPQWGAK